MKRATLTLGALLALPAAGAAQTFPTTPPTLGPAPAVTPPVPVQRTLANGMKVLYVRQPELPVVSAALVIRGAGTTEDPATLPGLASFTASMLDEGAAGKGALQIADALDLLGASLNTGAGWDAANVNLYVLKKNFAPALGIMADVVLRPDFNPADVQRVRDERVTNLTRAKDEPTAIANNAFQALVYGARHPYGRFATVEATRTLDRDRVTAFHHAAYRPENATLILVGDVDPSMQPMVEQAFGAWRATGTAPAMEGSLDAPQIGTTTIYLVDKPGAAQSEIRIGHPGVARNTPDFFALQVLNTLLGGAFTSRLNMNLRETHGWTYGARSGFSMRQGAGPFTAQAGVVTAATDSSLVEFFRELNRIRTEPIPAEELEKAKRYVALGFPQSLETTQDVAGNLANLVTYGIDPSFLGSYVRSVMAVTASDVKRVADQYVRPGNAVVVVVGDRSKIEAGIRAANLGPVQVKDVGEFVR
ncbi:MAG TPA: pitrilysin family protein [Longimicrobiaceae bacterium]|nr:pitrilysin family protein [Longimicrobiaceae bacterium]